VTRFCERGNEPWKTIPLSYIRPIAYVAMLTVNLSDVLEHIPVITGYINCERSDSAAIFTFLCHLLYIPFLHHVPPLPSLRSMYIYIYIYIYKRMRKFNFCVTHPCDATT
jgi:hypothetical protein